MASDVTRLTIELETVLRNLNKTLRGLDQVKQRLQSIASIRIGGQPIDKAALAAQRLSLQQQRLIVQTQELANKQERARQVTERLALSQHRLSQAQQRVSSTAGRQADAHVRFFRAVQKAAVDADTHVRFFKANEASLRKAPPMDAHVQAFRAIEKSAQQADAHVRAFRANEAFLRKSPQLDAHVQAFRALEAEAKKAQRSTITLDQALGRIGGSLRNLGLGLTSLGSSLSVALTAPLAALGVLSARNAVTLDSLNRGLTAITGSASEAGRQLSRLTEIAKLPGIGFQEAIQGSIRLQAVGFSAGVAERALIQFSNAVALTGGGREELARITVQLGQLAAKGKVLAQDLKPIIEAGPAVGRALLQAFGTVNSEDIQALGLSSQEFIETLLTQLEKLPRAAAGLRNVFDNFSDAIFRASAAIGSAILPVLTRLIEIAEPIITRLAEGFAALPAPLQTLVVTFGALAAAAGPALFVLGQFATGIGGLISAFGRLHALGLLPTIAGFKDLILVLRGATTAMTAQQIAAAGTAATLVGLGAAVAAVVALAVGIAFLAGRQKQAIKISKEQIAATDAEIAALQDQIKFVNSLEVGVKRTADEQDRLADIYAGLNAQAKIRLTAIRDESERLTVLREELQRLLQLRNEERVQQAANLAASLAATIQQIELGQVERDSIAARVRANVDLAKSIQETGRLTTEHTKQLARQGITANTVEDAVGALNAENENLIESQGGLIGSSKELNGTAEEQARALRLLQQQTGLSTRQLLTAAKAMGVFKGNVEAALPAIERYIAKTDEATKSTDRFNRSLSENERQLNKAGERADSAAKARRAVIESAAAVARETSVDFEGALKSFRQMIEAVPELRQALERERQLTGKSLSETIQEAVEGAFKGRDKDRSGTSLRNARERLANALLDVGAAEAEKQKAQLESSNERLLQANETSYAKQLRAYREYLETRALFTKINLDREIDVTRTVATNARLAEQRLLASALKSGISDTERVNRQAQAADQREKAIRAEAKLIELESERAKVGEELAQALAEASVQQVKDTRQLGIEFADLQGKIEDALNAATFEKFSDTLKQLSLTQAALNTQLVEARKKGRREQQAELERAIAQNQTQIDLIELIVQQELALNKLAAANELIRRAKERQAELEQQIAFDVEFRGLKEEEAIRRRLAGEVKLASSLRLVRDLIQAQVDELQAKDVKPPQALLEFIREINTTLRGLDELPLSEQFRIAEQEFNRLNEERERKIKDIERAIRERDIAEVEGLLIIRRINGQYAGDLEEQLALLKQIAERSNDASLQRQAQAAEDTVKDARSQLAGFDRQLRAASIDSLQQGFTDFFTSIGDRSREAKEKLLDLVDSVVGRINQVIAENLSERLIESLFGTEGKTGDRFLGLFKRKDTGGIAKEALGAAKAEITVSTAALTGGATTAGATIVAAGTTFAATVISAATALAAAIGLGSATQATGGLGSLLSGVAETGLYPAVPGGVYKFIEGGYPEAVLTTDPKHASRQLTILKAFLRETRGLGGRIKGFAAGAFISPSEAQSMILSGLNAGPSVSNPSIGELAIAGTPSMMRLRQVLVDNRDVGNWVNSPEGERVLVDFLYRNQPVIRKIGGK